MVYKTIMSFEKESRFIVGLDGLSRSGKTTIASEVASLLAQSNKQVYLFHIDDFITVKKERYHTGYEEWYEYYQLQWNADWLRKHLFQSLKTETNLVLPHYRAELDEIEMVNHELPKKCIVLIEGIFLQRTEWSDCFDYMFYVDCPRTERFLREKEEVQVKVEKFRRRYWKGEDYYLNQIKPFHKADFIIKG
ncbi:kinase [Bacillus testis]|uniref:kinase n=1 Tax=Bacillus testis TaxID=1622072 RepID=UPI00067F3F04|nr:kinase [Bacillus testis]